MRITLVISRHDEDVSWMSDVLASLDQAHVITVHVYDKGHSDLDADTTSMLLTYTNVKVVVTRLPNVGRESHTYLEHVIRTRKSAACTDGVTVFMQGRMSDHVPVSFDCIAAFIQALLLEASLSQSGESGNHACHTQYGSFNAIPELRVAMYPGVGDSGGNLRQWFTAMIGPWRWDDPADGPTWWQHGVFAIRTSRLVSSRTGVHDAYYEALRSEVDWHVNPEAGHFFERSWCYVFPPLQIERPG